MAFGDPVKPVYAEDDDSPKEPLTCDVLQVEVKYVGLFVGAAVKAKGSEAEAALKKNGHTVTVFNAPDAAGMAKLAQTTDLEAYDAVGVVGDDDTLTEALNGLINAQRDADEEWTKMGLNEQSRMELKPDEKFFLQKPIALFPCGGTTSTAKEYEVTFDKTVAAVKAGTCKNCDVGVAKFATADGGTLKKTTYFHTECGFNLGAVEGCGAFCTKRGSGNQQTISCFNLPSNAYKKETMKFDKGASIMWLQNNKRDQAGIQWLPAARPADSYLDLIVCEKMSGAAMYGFKKKAETVGNHLNDPVKTRQCKVFKFDTPEIYPVICDGKTVGQTPVEVVCKHKIFRCFM